MFYILLSIALNALLVVIFRLYTRYGVQNLPAIVINYLVCYLIGSLFTSGTLISYAGTSEAWLMMIGGLGLIFIIAFNIVAMTVQRYSVTVATLMQRMSVVMVVLYALFAFHERISLLQGIGLVAGLTAIYLISRSPSGQSRDQWSPYVLLPIGAFLLSGVIDISFYHMREIELTLGQEDRFATLLFLTAGLIGVVILGLRIAGGMRISWRDILGGVALGIPNYFSIYCLQKMLTIDMEGAVIYPVHNIGILILSTLLSYLLFNEHFQQSKRIGLALAILAVLLLTSS